MMTAYREVVRNNGHVTRLTTIMEYRTFEEALQALQKDLKCYKKDPRFVVEVMSESRFIAQEQGSVITTERFIL